MIVIHEALCGGDNNHGQVELAFPKHAAGRAGWGCCEHVDYHAGLGRRRWLTEGVVGLAGGYPDADSDFPASTG